MFRTVLIKNSSKLQYIQGYLVVYDGDKETKVFLKDITTLLIESTQTLITVPLLIELIKQNINVILCDEKHNPCGTFLAFNGHYRTSGNLYNQLEWEDKTKEIVWQKIIKDKLGMQIQVLKMYDRLEKIELLESYMKQIEPLDVTNREGLAAKVYFNELFGKSFRRDEQNVVNPLLNYAYSMILSCVNREITSAGYLTQLGIFHKGRTNPFNLGSDIMEPFRPIADIVVVECAAKNEPLKSIRKIFTKKIKIANEVRYIDDAIRVYTNYIIRQLTQRISEECSLELLPLREYTDD